MLLTKEKLEQLIKNNPKVERVVDYDEPNVAIVHTVVGFTWNALDGNRTVEGFNLKGHDEPDDVAYLKSRLNLIEPERI